MKTEAWVLVRNGAAESSFEQRSLELRPPGAGEVVVDAAAFGLNFADVMARLGVYPDAPPNPATLGYEVAGLISAVGPGVEGWNVGDRVMALTRFGGYGRRVVTLAEGLVALPEGLDFSQAAAIPVQGATAVWCAEWVATIHAGDTVLIRAAAGGVGLWLTQMAVAKGATVIATTRGAAKCDRLRALGAVPVVTNGTAADIATLRAAAPGGYDLIFDSLGGADARRSWGLLAHGGRMVCFGVATMAAGGWSRLLAPLRALEFGLFHPLVFLSSSRGLIGVNMLRVADARPVALRAVTERAAQLVADGTVKLELSRRPASELPAAHADLERGATVGKLVMEWPT